MQTPGPFYAALGPFSKNRASRKNYYCYLLKVHFYIYIADFLFCSSELPVGNLLSIPWSYQDLYITQCLHVIGHSFRTSLTGHWPPFSSPKHGISTPEQQNPELFWSTPDLDSHPTMTQPTFNNEFQTSFLYVYIWKFQGFWQKPSNANLP